MSALACEEGKPAPAEGTRPLDGGALDGRVAQRDASDARVIHRGDGSLAPPATVRTPVTLDECATSAIAAGDIAALKQGGSSDGMRVLYPYEGTVFPRGLGAPLLMWEGGAGASLYLRITADAYDYQGCMPADADGRVRIPASAWEAASVAGASCGERRSRSRPRRRAVAEAGMAATAAAPPST